VELHHPRLVGAHGKITLEELDKSLAR